MCGIVGYLGNETAADVLLEGLRRLEYRGYDSAGLAIYDGAAVNVIRTVGKLRLLDGALKETPLSGQVGIGHTRWATHGRPTEVNAHPHQAGTITVVHNGIIENYLELKTELVAAGHAIKSETDTEIVAHLIQREWQKTKDTKKAVRQALKLVRGAYAIAVLNSLDEGKQIVVAKKSSPLVLGQSEHATYCGSDVPALLSHTRDMIFLDDEEIATLKHDSIEIETLEGKKVERDATRIDWSPVMAEKAGYRHFMLKEIFEQPRALEDTIRGRIHRDEGLIEGREVGLGSETAKSIERVVLTACGTSHYAAQVGRYFIESIAKIPTSIEIASEFRGRDPVIGEKDLLIGISQSGETLDTLVAAQAAKEKGATILAIANVIGSAIPRLADGTFYTHAGPEIGVASTKCFSVQLLNMLMLSIWLGHQRGTLDSKRAKELCGAISTLPTLVQETLDSVGEQCLNLARKYMEARDVLYLGRGLNFPIALEGALKLKEVSYIHAEGYPAGEMKHGPIALIDAHVPVFVILPQDEHYERSFSNLQEAAARDGQTIAVATEGDKRVGDVTADAIFIPDAPSELTPFLTILPLQLFAYHVADLKGTDVDQPRNLAKTVTVE